MSSSATTSTAVRRVSAKALASTCTCQCMLCISTAAAGLTCCPFSCMAAPAGATVVSYTIASGPHAGFQVFWCKATTAAILIVLSM